MTDENTAPDGAEYTEAKLRVEALDADTLSGATQARLSIEGERDSILALAEAVLMILAMDGAQIGDMVDSEGNVLNAPSRVDFLATGDDPVA